jgi:uncharacterized protein (DUF342 family)
MGFERRSVAESRTETAPVNFNGGVVIRESVADAFEVRADGGKAIRRG